MYEKTGEKLREEDAKAVSALLEEALKNNQEAQNYMKMKEEIKQSKKAPE